MKRRHVLIAIAAIPAISVTWFARLLAGKAGRDESVHLMRDLEGLFTDITAAIDVGESCLTSCGRHPAKRHLLQELGIDPNAPSAFNREAFHRLRQRDFAQSNTLLVDGWLVARSEVCACALLATLHRERQAG